MTAATFIAWENRLGKMVKAPGGVKLTDALDQAGKNLDSIQDACMEAMDAQLDELERLCAEGGRQPTEEIKNRIYDVANEVLAVAGAFTLSELGQAAFCLCELVDRLRAGGKWNQAAVEVHLSAFRLLRQPGEGADRSSVIAGLKGLTDRVAVIAE
ncbi:MAG TPA: hypothetical protein VIJ94_16580 [Caulobacteraceae bacterium]